MQLFTSGLPSTLTDDGSGNLTFTGKWINTRNSAADAPADTMTGTWFTGGTTTTTKPHFLIEPAGTTSNNWSTAGTGFGVNAPSGFAGELLELQLNGVRRMNVNAAGAISIGFPNAAMLEPGSDGCFMRFVNVIAAGWAHNSFQLSSGTTLGFNSANALQGGFDLQVVRDAADSWAQRRGTNPQRSRIYNTFTSATNFERLNIRWASNEAIIDTEAGSGGGTLRGLKIGSASTSLLGFYGATPIAQGAAVADATDAASVITQLNALLARVRAVGLIAT